jgi:hypothetical protein
VRSAPLAVTAQAPPWGLALANRRFRWLLLAIAGVPITLAYLWFGLLRPLLSGGPSDFVYTYLAGARMLAAGADPYLCNAGQCGGHPHYLLFYPPFAFWLMQPLAGLDETATARVALVAANLFLVAFIWLMLRALQVTDRQAAVTVVLGTISFAPTLTEIQNRNLQSAVLLISAIVLVAWLKGDRWWGGAGLGIALAIKLIQAPLLLLAAWGRRFRLAAAAVLVWAVLWLVGAPQYLLEYLLRVAPSQASGSPEVINVAPFGTINRLFHPESLYNSGLGGGPVVLGLAVLFGVAVLAWSWWRLRTPRADRSGRALEVAVAVAASPLLVTLVYAGQFMLLLLPMIVVFDFGLRMRSRSLVIAVAAAWLLLGPSYLAFTNALAAGVGTPLIFQLWANSPVAGVIVLWLTTVHALKLHAAAGNTMTMQFP